MMKQRNIKIDEDSVKFISSSMVPPDVQVTLDVTPVNRKVQKSSLGYIAGKRSIVFSLNKVAYKIIISVCVEGGGGTLVYYWNFY